MKKPTEPEGLTDAEQRIVNRANAGQHRVYGGQLHKQITKLVAAGLIDAVFDHGPRITVTKKEPA